MAKRKGNISTTLLNRRERRFYLENGETIDIVAMTDNMGNATTATTATLGVYCCDGFYKAIALDLFEDETGREPVHPALRPLDCEAVNKFDRNFRLTDGARVNWTAMLDGDLRPTDNVDDAVIAVCKLPGEDLYRGLDLRAFDPDMHETVN